MMRKALIILLIGFVAWQSCSISFAGTYSSAGSANTENQNIDGVEVQSKDFSSEFPQAAGLAQLANELKHIWSGKEMTCEHGWWNSVLQNPFQYFEQQLVGYIIGQLGSQFLSVAEQYAGDLAQCANPEYTLGVSVAGQGSASGITLPGSVGSCTPSTITIPASQCVQSVTEDVYNNAASALASDNPFQGNQQENQMMEDMLNKLGFNVNLPTWITSPAFSMIVGFAIDTLMSFDHCDGCHDEKCAEHHNSYDTWGLIKGGNCVFVRENCSWHIPLIGCLRHKRHYCCYDSTFTRILVQQAYQQLGYSFQNGCSQLTFNDLKRLNFAEMAPALKQYLETKLKGKISNQEVEQAINQYYSGYQDTYGPQTFTGLIPGNNSGNSGN